MYGRQRLAGDGGQRGRAKPKGPACDAGAFEYVPPPRPPVLSVPAAITAEATGPAGAVVTYAATANDDVDGAVPVTCSPASGATFPFGTTTVVCTASDRDDNTSVAEFTVTVADMTPPVLSLPANMTVDGTGTLTPVSYVASATDVVDGAVPVSCTPASGSGFSVGTTTGNCSAHDNSGNGRSGRFTVTVLGADLAVSQAVAVTVTGKGNTTTRTLTFSITVTNNGPLAASGVTMHTSAAPYQYTGGTFPKGVAGSCTVASSGTAIDCTLTNPLGSGASVTATVQVKTQNTVANIARVSATTPDPEPGNNTSSLQKRLGRCNAPGLAFRRELRGLRRA